MRFRFSVRTGTEYYYAAQDSEFSFPTGWVKFIVSGIYKSSFKLKLLKLNNYSLCSEDIKQVHIIVSNRSDSKFPV